jgi:hypothetical protein
VEAFHNLEPRQQKAHLPAILKSANIYNDDRVELEFRD